MNVARLNPEALIAKAKLCLAMVEADPDMGSRNTEWMYKEATASALTAIAIALTRGTA